jgi:hypothetical protein
LGTPSLCMLHVLRVLDPRNVTLSGEKINFQ